MKMKVYAVEDIFSLSGDDRGCLFVKLKDYYLLEKELKEQKRIADKRGYKHSIGGSECGNCGSRRDD